MSDLTPYYQDEYATIYHGDCRDILYRLPIFDLVLTDPPYGIGEARPKNRTRSKPMKGSSRIIKSKDYGNDSWDDNRIANSLMLAILGSANSSIIFGGNYYTDILSLNTCWLVWDKKITGDFADCELAWTNLKGAVRKKEHLWNGMIRKGREERFHPTQKPLDLMIWCIETADKKQKTIHETILDPFMGSGTTLLAARRLSRRAVGIEREEKYCEIAAKRLSQDVLPLIA